MLHYCYMNVTFDEENNSNIHQDSRTKSNTPLIDLALKTGLAKDRASANKILLGVAIAAFTLTAIIVLSSFIDWGGSTGVPTEGIPPELQVETE